MAPPQSQNHHWRQRLGEQHSMEDVPRGVANRGATPRTTRENCFSLRRLRRTLRGADRATTHREEHPSGRRARRRDL
eukprot:7406161-Alexandrium_andersonii.AAC.1